MTLRGICITAGGRNGDQRSIGFYGALGSLHQSFAHGHAHGAAHEGKVEGGDHGLVAADLAFGHHDGVVAAGLAAGFLDPVGIGLPVLEFQRIRDDLAQFDLTMLPFIEQQGQALVHSDAQVMTAVGTDPLVGRQLAVKNHLTAGRALFPEVVGDVLLGDQRADLRPHKV